MANIYKFALYLISYCLLCVILPVPLLMISAIFTHFFHLPQNTVCPAIMSAVLSLLFLPLIYFTFLQIKEQNKNKWKTAYMIFSIITTFFCAFTIVFIYQLVSFLIQD